MSPLITDRVMTECTWYHFATRVIGVAAIVMALTAGLSGESQAQMKPSMKVKLNVLSSINISNMEAKSQSLFSGEVGHLNELMAQRNRGANPVVLSSGFSISADENITVLLSFTTPVQAGKSKKDSHVMRMLCGYLNDGTTYLSRATFTNKNVIQFRLRNNSLLRRSMKLDNSLFVAYVLFLTNQRNEQTVNESSMPVSTVTVEFM
jgi:hypothetical protein